MADEDKMDIVAEILPTKSQRRIRASLKEALQDQLKREAKTLGDIDIDGDSPLAIHGRTGVSNLDR